VTRRLPARPALRAIGWARWDPIGLGEPRPSPGAEDGCDRRLVHAAGTRGAGRPVANVSTDLQGITRHRMALPRAVPEAALGAAEAIAAAVGAG
jgi:hypothetical protein